MKANYHAHTWRCNHATGTEREYIECAIASGFSILGFSDHTPNPCSWMMDDGIRMLPEQTEEYFRTMTNLKKEYAGQIELHVGVEVEYEQESFEGLCQYLSQFPCEYMLMGQHYTDGIYVRTLPYDEAALSRHVDQILQGLATGKFLYLAHPDLYVWAGDRSVYTREMTRLCEGVKALGIPMEYNLLGLRKGRNYPSHRFWKIAAQVGNDVILGVDAHDAADMDVSGVRELALENLLDLGMDPIETVKL